MRNTVCGFFVHITIFALVYGKDLGVLNTCLDGKHHKTQPGPEDNLFQCNAYVNNSCCTNYTAKYLHGDGHSLYNFNYSHCAPMSDKCRQHFTMNNCFYECSPNLGPWVKTQKISYRSERIYKVPLCASECQSWWNDCRDERTCVENWSFGFVWNKNGNHCPKNSRCKYFHEVYHNSTYFCEKLWGPDDFMVVDDADYCMKMSITQSNPQVAYHYALKKHLIKGTEIPPYSQPPKVPPLKVQGTVFSIVIGVIILVAITVAVIYFVWK
uniref:Folate receptor-like domain-containing protein n=1 Tax=Ciona savignyi TaxID=51511 RepID=H2Y7Z2_CIOSA